MLCVQIDLLIKTLRSARAFQGSRMEEQRCSLPQRQTPATQLLPKKDLSAGSGPPRSASFSPGSDLERSKAKDTASQKTVVTKTIRS